jgi:hypothetical protein
MAGDPIMDFHTTPSREAECKGSKRSLQQAVEWLLRYGSGETSAVAEYLGYEKGVR